LLPGDGRRYTRGVPAFFYVPYILLFFYDGIARFKGVSNPKTWRYYVGIGITIALSFLAVSYVSGKWGDFLYWAICGVGFVASYIWNNSADTSGDGF
jgi:hypothetical protein